MRLTAGQRLGPYEILAPVGSGGMGEVYRARDTRLGREVALKVTHERFTERFEREAQIVAALNHANICPLYDVGPNFLVMELVEGPTLADRLLHGAMSLEEALDIAYQISDALDAAHERGIIHRDLKPANIKIQPDGAVKVLDFGLAKVERKAMSSSDSALTLTATEAGSILGTPSYMAPEQARGKAVDKRADIWAFGVVVYEMLTGRRLFTGASVTEILGSVLTRDPDWGLVPARALPLLRHCLEKDPKRRLRDIGETRFLLELPQAITQARRGWLPWAVTAILGATLCGALWMLFKPAAPRDRPLLRMNVDLGPEAIQGSNLEAAISPDGTRLVFPARAPDGQTRLAVRPLRGSQISFLAGTEGAASPFFSSDGDWIGFRAGSKFKKAPLQGGAVEAVADATATPFGVSWDDRSNIVFVPGMVNSLYRVAADGKRIGLTRAGERGDGTHRWPQFLPGGNAVLFTSHKIITGFDDATIEAVSVPAGERKVLVRGGYFGRYMSAGGKGYLLYVREGALFAVRFDAHSLTVQGQAAAVLDDVAGDWDTGAGQFDSANNGTLIYRAGSGPDRKWPILWMDSSGKTEPLLPEPGPYYNMRLSPDGKRLAITVDHGDKGREIEVYDMQRGSLSRLTFTGEVNLFPVWSPDGKYIVFETSSSRGYDLGLVRSDGSGTLVRLAENNGLMIPNSFSPDGRQLAYTAGPDAWAAPFDTTDPDRPGLGKPELLLRGGFAPTISPDGHWLAYTSNESGRNEVYVQPFPRRGLKIQISTNGCGYAGLAWAPAGHDLFFMGLDNRLMATGYSTSGDVFNAGKPRVWSSVPIGIASTFPRQFSLSPDGKHFAIFPPRATPPPSTVHVMFALNFGDELQRRVK